MKLHYNKSVVSETYKVCCVENNSLITRHSGGRRASKTFTWLWYIEEMMCAGKLGAAGELSTYLPPEGSVEQSEQKNKIKNYGWNNNHKHPNKNI